MFKNICLSLIIALSFSACMGEKKPFSSEVAQEKTSEKNLSEKNLEQAQDASKEEPISEEEVLKEEYYFGSIPCKDCDEPNGHNVKIWLKLSTKQDEILYDLIELHEQQTDTHMIQGEGEWQGDDAILSLGEKMIFVGNDTVTFIDDPSQMLQKAYTIEKLEFFDSSDERLFLNAKNIQKGKVRGHKALRFQGISNLKNDRGFLSVLGTYVLDCHDKTYNKFGLVYYEKAFNMGEIVANKKGSSSGYLPIEEDSAYEKVYQKHCKQ